jgi:cytochrome P450
MDLAFKDSNLGIVIITLFLGTILLVSIFVRGKKSNKKLPPLIEDGFFSSLSKLLGPKGHEWLVQKTLSINSKVYRLPLTPPGFHFIIVADANLAREILYDPTTMKFKPFFKNLDKFSGGPGILTSEGFRYKHARKAIMPAFGSDYNNQMITCISKFVDIWISTKLQNFIQNDESVDINLEMQLITSKIISEFGFQYDLTEDQASKIISGFKVLMKEYLQDNILNPTREYFWYFYPGAKAARDAKNYIVGLMYEILFTHRSKGDTAPQGTIVDIIDKNPNYLNDHDRVNDIILFIGAGYETTAGALSWALYLLAKDLSYQTKLRSVIRSTSDEDAYHHAMVRNVIREALRLYPPGATGNPRVLGRDFTYNGMLLPKGSIFTTPPYVIQRDPDYFENPNEFLPSRWDSPTQAMLNAYQPFSIGRRNCMGMSLAYLETQIVLVKLIKDYEFTTQGECDSYFNFLLLPQNLRLIPRKIE